MSTLNRCYIHNLQGVDAEMADNGQGVLVCVLDQGHYSYLSVQGPNGQ